MALEELKAQIGYLVGQMVDRPEDAHEIYERIRENLNELRAMGNATAGRPGRTGEAARRQFRHGQRLR